MIKRRIENYFNEEDNIHNAILYKVEDHFL